MILELGHFSLILAFCLTVALSVIPLVGALQRFDLWMQAAKSISVGYFCFLLTSVICLNQWGLTPLIISLMLSVITMVVVLFPKKISNNKTAYVLSILGVINAVFLLFMFISSNPFSHVVSSSSVNGKNFNSSEMVNQSLIGKRFPSFSLASMVDDNVLITQNDLLGKVSLVNIWATWCASCRVEHPQLLKLAMDNKIFVVGINYKDNKNAAQKWLSELGNPYFFSIYDGEGKLGTDLGVSGAPETYIVDKQGIIRYKYVGVVSEDVWLTKLKPEFDKWQKTK